jgi:predicted glycoside hydrolase/deacetylase ChbG (UPF0249 family)
VLIVNADDVGASRTATDAAVVAFDEGLISSCSAMVWMRDSERAATVLREHKLPAGLHLNLTLPFDGTEVPSTVRERQLELIEYFDSGSWRDDVDDKPPRDLVRNAISDQLARFAETYGNRTHLDGHHHVHVHEAVLRELPRGAAIRPILREPTRFDARPNRRERRLGRRFRTPAMTLAFEHLHPDLGGVGLDALERLGGSYVEVMVHPQQPGQLDALRSTQWRTTLSAAGSRSYAVIYNGDQPDR